MAEVKVPEHMEQLTVLPEVDRILKKLGYVADLQGKDKTEEWILPKLTTQTRQYLQQIPTEKWPTTPNNTVPDPAESNHLKNYLGWSLAQDKFHKAVAAMLMLDNSSSDAVEPSLFDDVMQYIEQKGPSNVIPPQLLVSWARILQVKGDLHGAIRKLNAAQTLLLEHRSSFACPCEAERIRGDCTQLAGLTLNKMCCWKSAIQPLMESIDTFRGCDTGEKNKEAMVVSMEMVAKCLCNITHGDYMELKEQLGFQHNDRFYHAYMICKDAASLAVSSELLYIRAQNQAAESLLKYAAQHEDTTKRFECLQTVIAEAHKSLQAHTSVSDLARREQFFEFIHSLFLVFLALDFSDNPQDCMFADTFGEQARILYAEYCRQLSENGFQLARINVKKCPDAESIIGDLIEEFDLRLDLHTTPITATPGKAKEMNYRERKLMNKQEKRNGRGAMKASETQDLNGHNEAANSLPGVQAANGNVAMLEEGTADPSREKGAQGAENQRVPPPRRRQEVGLPVDPHDYAIPVYDVPCTIFQDLCGCKFTGVQTQAQNPQLQSGDRIILQGNDAAGEAAENTADHADGGPMRGITQDSGYGSSVALVNTFLTTKLPESDTGSSSDVDSGIESSLSATDSIESRPFIDGGLVKTPRPSLPVRDPLTTDSVKKARLLKFNPVTGVWSSQTSLVYVGQPLPLHDNLKGNCRDALHVQFLHQDEVLGRYVGKRYRRQRPPSQYLQDVTCQKTARFLVTLFNYALNDLRYDIQVVYLPVAHLQLLSRDGDEVEDWLNVEPYLEGDFIKLTNNLKFCNSQGRTLATALTHFTHTVSEGKLMLVDLQGWLPREGRGVVYLTDPQFHTNNPTSLSSCDMGQRGMQAFWESVHPQCNAICHALGLKRPEDEAARCCEKHGECTRL